MIKYSFSVIYLVNNKPIRYIYVYIKILFPQSKFLTTPLINAYNVIIYFRMLSKEDVSGSNTQFAISCFV